MPNHKGSKHKGSNHKVISHKKSSRQLPCSALQLISEYSKPITRPDWRTFPRTITKNIFFYESDNLNEVLRNIIFKNRYDYLYAMSKKELIGYLYKQNAIIKELKNEDTSNFRIAMNKRNNESTHNIIKLLLTKNKKSKIRRRVNKY